MSSRLPEYISPLDLADKGARLAGTFECAQMPRLLDSLSVPSGVTVFDLRFDKDAEGICFATGVVSADLTLRCQRCMEPMQVSVGGEVRLELLPSGQDQGRLPGYEAVHFGEEPVSLIDLVEDEIILALPMIPSHNEGDCPASVWPNEQCSSQAASPFSVLSKLMRKTE